MSPSLQDIFLFSMTSACYNHRLQQILFPCKVPNPIRCLISIHNRHRAVHKNKSEAIILFIKCLFNFLNSLLSIVSMSNNLINTIKPSLQQRNLQAHNIIRLIINNQNPSVLISLLNNMIIFRAYLFRANQFQRNLIRWLFILGLICPERIQRR